MTEVPADYLSPSSPYNYEQPLPAVARTNSITQVPPTKKITFFKSGDPQFGGVKMAINQRSFKSFNALMDDLSHRVPLPFGVRTITTPRGIHCISTLDQLEDGGCYLCSDKKYVKPFSISTGRRVGSQWNGRPVSALRRGGQESRHEDHLSQQGHKVPKKITLVKNGDISIRRMIILNHRNARSFKTLLDEISELLQFTVKKLYTLEGKKIDSMQALLHCPSMLVCVGREPFKPLVMENSRKHSAEKLPGLASQPSGKNINENNGSKKDVNFGLKAKKSVIHPRSASSNRSMRFSLSSEKSYANGLNTSLENGAPFPNHYPHGKAGDLVHSLVNDDIEKRVHVNKDGSLSVEMKVRFRLLNDETLQWSTQIKKSNLMSKTPCEESGAEEDNGMDPMQKMNPELSSEADDSFYPCDADSYISKLDESESEETHCHSCGKQHQDYDIWKNPLHASQKEEPGIRNTWHTRSSCSNTSSRRRVIHRKMTSVDSVRTTSSEEYSEHIVQESSCYSETTENRVEYCNITKHNYQRDLSTAASSGEKQQECNRMNTGNSQTASSLGRVSYSSCDDNRDTEEAVDKDEASKSNAENEDENGMEVSSVKCSKEDMDEMEGSRVGSSISRSSLHSRQSKKSICEEVSSMARTMSSCSLKKAEEDSLASASSANSVYSRSSKNSTPRAKSNQEEHSDNDPVISSISSDSCSMKEAEEKEAKQEDHKDNEVSSVSAKMMPSESIKDEVGECESSVQGSSHSKECNGSNRMSDNDEILVCNASCSSKTSKRSKQSQIHLDARSEMSMSSLGSTSKQKKKNSLHAEDSRSNSKASNHSKSSCEIKKKCTGDHTSPSDSLPSSTSSVSETADPPVNNEDQSTNSTSKGYSKSSEGTKPVSQPDKSSKISSPSSSFSNANGNDGEGNAKVRSDTPSSRHGSLSESLCSKCDHAAEAGNGNAPSSSSRISSYSDMQGKSAEIEVSRTSNDGCSQSSVTQTSKTRRKKRKNLHAEVENSSKASASEVASMYSLHCPVPPKGKPSGKKTRMVAFKNSTSTSACTESALTEDKEQKEVVGSSRPTSSGSKSAQTNTMKPAENNSNDRQKEDNDSCKEKIEGQLQEVSVPEGNCDLAPSALPNASPEEVVQEWLSKIPPETLLMKYEMEDDGAEECAETNTEISTCANNQEISDEETAEKEDAGEGENVVEEEMEKEAVEANADNEGAEECLKKKTFEVTSGGAEANQAECSQSVETSSQNNNKKDLPSTIQTSVQIMKALLNSKQEAKFDRSNSLPEVSPTMGRKLSNSANILITCLASLQFLDEEPLCPLDKSKCLNKPRYTELLNIFQALWFGGTVEKGGPSSDQPGSDQTKMSSGFKAHSSTYNDITPMSSSGVDVSSGSGGSREGSMAGARDCTLLPQKTVKSKSAEHGANLENEPDLNETEVQDNEGEQCSRPSTSCSKFKREEKQESTEMASAEREAEEDCHKDERSSNCENDKGGKNEENGKLDENEGEAEAEAGGEITSELNTDEAAEQPSNTTETDTNADEANGEKEAESNLEEQVGDGSLTDLESSVKAIPKTSVKTYSTAEQKSVDPDPVWVLRLLKKIEKTFMTHYVNAMNEFKSRWNLDNNELLDKMISELKDEVSKRIQKSIEKELRKIKSRAGQRTPKPPDETLRRESTIQTEQKRQWLQTMRNRSLLNDRNMTQSKQPGTTDLSFDVDEEDFGLSTALGDDASEQPSEEEYCPCDACIRKKMASKPIRNPVVAANAPIVKAFDLKQILRMKEESETENMQIDCASEAVEDRDAIPSEHMEEAEEKTNPGGEDGEYDPDDPVQEPEDVEEKGPEQCETDEQGEQAVSEEETAAPGEGGKTSDNQNWEEEEEKEAKEEEEEQAEKEEEEQAVEEEEARENQAKEEEDEAKEDEDNEEEEQAKGEEDEAIEDEDNEEEEQAKEEEDDAKEDEGSEEEEVKEEEGNEEEEMKQEEGTGEVGEEEKEGEETQNDDLEREEGPGHEEETDGGVEEAEDEADGVSNEPECEEKADISDALEDPEEAATGKNEEELQDDAGDETVEEASPVVESVAEEEDGHEGNTERAQENDNDEVEEAAADDHEQDNEEDRDAVSSQVPEMASDVTGDQDHSEGPETLTKTAAFSCNSSVGNCSQQSQKGSEDGSEVGDKDEGNMSDAPDGEAESDASSKPAKMYPDSEEEDEVEDRASSCTSPMAGEKNAADLQNDGDTNDSQGSKKKTENVDEIDQDDLDF